MGRVVQSGGQSLTQVGAGLVAASGGGLIVGVLAGRLLGSLAMARDVIVGRPWSFIAWRRLREVAVKHKHFPAYATSSSLLTTAGTAATPLLFGLFFSLQQVGYITLDVRILGLPAALVGQAVGQVFYARAARDKELEGVVVADVHRVGRTLILVSFPVFLAIMVGAPFVFPLVFGSDWAEAATIAQLMAPWLAVGLVSSALSTLPFVKGRQRTALAFTAYETFLRFGAILLGAWLSSVLLAVALYSAAGMVISLVYLGGYRRLAGSSLRELTSGLGRFLVLGLISTITLVPVATLTPLAGVAIVCLCLAVLWGLAEWWHFRSEFISF